MNSELLVSSDWKEFELIDAGDGLRLERWGSYILVRPDPQAVWAKSDNKLWQKADAYYKRSSTGGGEWIYSQDLEESWTLNYKEMTFKVRPTGFKHTGLFPEQACNWDWILENVKKMKVNSLINLFGYSGAASVAAALGGANVCHVDASKGAVNWCKENAHLSEVPEGKLRLIVDDCMKFIEREKRREKSYDAIVMDPPAFGRGANGEVWKLQDDLWELFQASKAILSKNAKFVLINSYTSGLSPLALHNIAQDSFGDMLGKSGTLTCGEIGLPFRNKSRIMPCGIYCRVVF